MKVLEAEKAGAAELPYEAPTFLQRTLYGLGFFISLGCIVNEYLGVKRYARQCMCWWKGMEPSLLMVDGLSVSLLNAYTAELKD